ncbi:hypothetical protein C0995_009106 [Termitomyces sp. Mi166|nr:hypothetical protein C0995_009106 [Termitomyces sp. Mi166\
MGRAHMGLAVQSLFQGFIYDKTQDANIFFHNNVFPKRKAIYLINTLLADTLLVRCLEIFVKWKILTFPLVLLLSSAVCAIKTIVANALARHSSVFDPTILSWITSTFVLNIATQITATSLIAFRIYHALNFTGPKFQVRYMSLIWLIVESGAIYTSAAIIQLITYLLKMNVGVIMEFTLAQICGITPNLILIRVVLGFTFDKKVAPTEDVVLSTFHNTYGTPSTMNHTQGEESLLDEMESHIPAVKVSSPSRIITLAHVTS